VERARAELLSGRVLPQTVTYARGFADPLIGFEPEVRKPQIVGRSGWRRPGRGTERRWPSCRLTRWSCSEATPPSPPSSSPTEPSP